MTLRLKALAVFVILMICLVGGLYLASHFILIRGLKELEEKDLELSVQRITKLFDYNFEQLSTRVNDWSAWDDTYAFIQDGNAAYIASNCPDETFTTIRVDVILFLDSSCRLVFGKGYDDRLKSERQVPASLLTLLRPGSPLLAFDGPLASHTGFLVLPEGVLLFASRPITTSQNLGPVRGTVFMARFLDQSEVGRLATIAGVTLVALPAGGKLPPDFERVLPSLGEQYVVVQRSDDSFITGYTTLRDYFGKPALLLKVTCHRDIYTHGLTFTRDLVFGLTLGGILLSLVMLLIFERFFLSRLVRLGLEVSRVGAGGDPSKRVAMGGGDEVSRLAGAVNRMLGDLETSQSRLRESEERSKAHSDAATKALSQLQGVFKALPDLYFRIGSDGTLLDCHAGKASDLFLPPEEFLGKRMRDVLPPQAVGPFDEGVRELRAGKPLVTYEYELGLPGGAQAFEARLVRHGSDEIISVVRNISRRKEQEHAIERRERYLETLVGLHRVLLQGSGLTQMGQVLEPLGQTSAASRVYLFRNSRDPEGRLVTSQISEWCAERTSPEIDDPALQNFLLESAFSRWAAVLSQGDIIAGKVADFPASERALLEARGILSVLVLPLIVDGRFWGFIGFESRDTARDWEPSEVALLSSAAGAIALSLQRKQAEEDLQESELKFRTLSETATSGIIIFQGEELIYFNPAAEMITGYSREELLRKRFWEVLHPDFAELVKERGLARLKGESVPSHYEVKVLTKDGKDKWLDVTAGRTSYRGEAAVVITATDITERKRSEEIQRAASRISESAFAAGSMNEIYASIHTIIGDLMEARNLFIALLDEEADLLSFPYQVDQYDRPFPPQKPGRGLTEYVLRTGQPLLAPPETISDLVCRGEVERRGTRSASWLGVPLKIREKTIGVLAVQSYTEGITYGEAEKGILQFVSTQVAMAVERKRAEEALRESEHRFRQLAETTTAAILIYQEDTFKYVNPAGLAISGYKLEDVHRLSIWDVIYPGDLDLVRSNFIKRSRGEPAPPHYEFRIMAKSGGVRWVDAGAAMIQYEGRPAGLMTAFDITERKRAEEELKIQKSYFQQLFESSPEALVILDSEDRVLNVNKGFEKLFQYRLEDIEGQHINDFLIPENLADEGSELSRRVLANEVVQKETVRKRKDGRLVPVAILGFPITSEEGQTGVYCIYRNISERKRAEQRLEYLAHNDTMTGLPNRVYLYQVLRQCLAAARRKGESVGILFVDLDRFKEVNDALGHEVGDMVLQTVARRLSLCVREGDTVARMGSDEFALLLPGVPSAAEAEAVAEKIRAVFSRPFSVAAHEFHITASIGISLFPEDGDDPETLVRNADLAMYRAKARGGNLIEFSTPDLSASAAEQVALKNSLRRALEEEAFFLQYQPMVNMTTERIVKVEALIRWHHPELGLIPPSKFIAVAEESGLILPMGEWVLRTACAQNKAWQAAGIPPIVVAVNLSARQFQQKDLVDVVDRVLKETGLDPRYLELEVTESTAMWDLENTIGMLRELNGLGVRIAIDDFGKGYSSLAYIQKFPLHTLKIDQAFIHDAVEDAADAAIVKAIITLAHGMRLEVVAEGVETVEQFVFLRATDCDIVQGFYFSKPAIAEDFKALLLAQESPA